MRTTEHEKLDRQFIERWSPRSFKEESIAPEDISTLFEAARWAPSCFNEQPWLFVYASTPQDRKIFEEVLVETNRLWARKAPLLIGVFSKRKFDSNGKENRWADFDSGAAWMALALQAQKLGYACHGMAGFDQNLAYEVCGVTPQDYNAICFIAVGRTGSPEVLPDNLREKEQPNQRKALDEFVFESHL